MAMACSSSSASTPRTTAPNCFRSLASRSKSRAHATDILITRSRFDRQKSGSSSETVSSIAGASRGEVSALNRLSAAVAMLWMASGTPAPPPPTFARDVAPILVQHCTGCHRPDGSAPFSLLTFAEARPRAKQIAAAVRRRAMPPWKPEPGYGEFVGSRLLTDAQIAAITGWVDLGAPLGDLAESPPAPTPTDAWQLGPPDLIVEMTEAYRLPADGADK